MSESHRKAAEVGRKGWDLTYSNTYQRGKRLARRRLPIEEVDDAEDKLHDAYVRLLERVPDADGIADRDNYALKAVQNICIDRCKSRSRLAAEHSVPLDTRKDDENDQPLLELPDPERSPEMNAQINEQTEILLRQLKFQCADLTVREKRLLVLHLQGFLNDEIARDWDEDVKIIRVEMNAVLAKIRYRLQHGQGKQKGASQP